MSKTIKSLFVAVGILSSAASFAANNIPPSDGIPVCAAVYGTLARYASPENKAVLQARAQQLAQASTRYNPQGATMALNLLKDNIRRVDANDPTIVQEVGNAEKGCRSYLPAYGL